MIPFSKSTMYIKLLICILLIVALFCGCQAIPAELHYTTDVLIVFSEPHGENYAVKNGVQTQYGSVTYSFVADIPERDRHAFIEKTVKAISAVEERLGILPGEYAICVRNDGYRSRVDDNTLYIGIENVGTQDFVIGIAQLLLGTDNNYGILYGLAADIAREIGCEVEESAYALDDALDLYDDAPIYLDLNYACFLEAYADAETLGKVKTIACGFYDYLVSQEQTDLFTDYSDAKYYAYLSHFLAENGKGSFNNRELAETRFLSGGNEVRLVWETPFGVFYLRDDFTPKYLDDPFQEDMLNSGYANLRQIVVDYTAQVQYIEQKIGDYAAFDKTVAVVFKNERYVNAGGYYDSAANEIRLFSFGAFMHEYGHYLLDETDMEPWRNEAICHYYSQTPVNEQITYLWYADLLRTEGLDPSNPQDAQEYALIQAVIQHIGHEFDWKAPKDYAYLNSAYIVAWDMFDSLTDPNSGIVCKHIFMDYLVGLAGEKTAVNAMVHDTPEEAFGKTWVELIADWEAYLNAAFSWAKEYGKD